jgi:hypothetical protein
MRNAAMPGEDEQWIAGEPFAKYVGIGKDRAEPPKTALLINAPAMPCVMVSMRLF